MDAALRSLFPEMMERKDKGLCSTCGAPVTADDFDDELSVKEFRISGMCQGCQNKTFGV